MPHPALLPQLALAAAGTGTLAQPSAVVLWTEVAALLVVARLLGALARRLGQPDIVGSLLAGLLLGPAVFGHIWPAGFHWFLPPDPGRDGLLYAVSGFCLIGLLVVLGAETDLPLIRSLGRPAAAVTTGSIALPLAVGILLGFRLPPRVLGGTGHPVATALLVAGVVSVSSLPVVARIISELGLTRRNLGQLAVAAATLNDAYGFLLLAVAAALAGGGGGAHLGLAIGGLVGLTAVVALGGQRVADRLLRRVRRHGPNVTGSLSVSLAGAFVLAALAQAIGVDAALGAFAAGLLLGRSRFRQGRGVQQLSAFSSAVFAPLYFATAGLQVDPTRLGRPGVLIAFVAVLLAGAASKYLGVWLGALGARLPAREGSALGIALNGRGAMQVILASAGLGLGLLGATGYTVLILAAIVTSLSVPPALRAAVRHWPGTPEEQQRLRAEERMRQNLVVRGQRILLACLPGTPPLAVAQTVAAAWPAGGEATVLAAANGTDPADLGLVRAALADREVRVQRVAGADSVAAVLAEARLGYGLIALGATVGRLSPELTEVVGRSPLPVLLVRRGRHLGWVDDAGALPPVHRILVPVAGTPASRAAEEVANHIGDRLRAEVRLLHVLTGPQPTATAWTGWFTGRPAAAVPPASSAEMASADAASAVVHTALAAARSQDLHSAAEVRQGPSVAEEITAAAADGTDLVLLGGTVRTAGDRVFLGHTVEHVLNRVVDPTVVLVLLPEAAEPVSEVAER